MPQANGQIRGRRYSLPSMPSNVARTVALLNKRPSNNEMRDITHQNGGVTKQRLHSRDSEQSLHRRVSVTDNHLFIRPSSPVDSDEDYFSDDSDSESWRDSVNSDVQILMNKDDEERLHGIFELINTEKNHIRDLKILLRIFKYKLYEKKYINESDSEQLFPALDELLGSCSKLYSQLKEHMVEEIDSPHSTHNIGNILIKNFSSDTTAGLCIRDAYARLGAKQLIAVKYYRDKCKDKAFKSLMDTLESKKVCKRRTYADFLLAVTTRLTKYPPLLKNLLKHTPLAHPDHDSLGEAISVVEEALHYIDNCVSQENQRAELQMCKNRFEVKGRCSRELKRFDLTSDKRRLIHRDQVTLHSSKTGSKDTKDTKLQLFLFSDYILLLKEKDSKLILNFDDTQCPAIKVKSCLVKNDSLEKLGFMLISNGGKTPDSPLESITKIQPTLYRFSANSADEKDTWIRLITEATKRAETEEDVDQTAANGLSSDERYDSEESDVDTNVSERDTTVSFDSDSVDLLVSNENSNITTPDSTRHLALEDIEEQNDDYLEDHALDYDDDDIERLVTVLRSMNTGSTRIRKHAFNRPLPRQTPKSGAAARRAVSLHLAEKQRVEENRRHTTCLSKEELKEAMNQTLPSNQTLQDNPVRQKSSDSGYAPDDQSQHTHHQPNSSHALMNMRDALLWVLQNDRKKNAEIEELRRENTELKEKVEQQSKSISRLEEEFAALRAALTSDQSPVSPQRPPYRPKRVLNTTTYSITEEKSENPQTRV